MARLFILFILTLCQACLVDAQIKYDRSDRTNDNLRGAVREVRVETTNSSMGDNISIGFSRSLSKITKYDTKGYKTEEIDYSTDGSVTGREMYNYNISGRLSEVALYNGDGSVFGKRIYSADGRKNTEVMTHYNVD